MANSKKRVFICGFHQESNSFNPVLSPVKMFYINQKDTAKNIYKYEKKSSPGGMASFLEEAENIETVYGILMRANSGAPAKAEVAEFFLEQVISDIREAGKIDGVAISLHGATMSDCSDDLCGDIVEAIRNEVGEDIPISAAFDLHANITDKLLKNLDYICGFQEYPHIDQFETGARAAKLLVDHLGGKPAKTVRVTIPMIAPAHAYTTKAGKLLELVNKARDMVASGRILDYTIFEVQPWLDAKEMASCIIVVAEDEGVAKEVASELAYDNFAIRRDLLGKPLMSVDEVIEKALANKSGKPVILVDSSDSRGAGSTADSAAVLEYLLPYADTLRCAVGVSDAPAVEKAFEVGVGNTADFTLGATISPELSAPVKIENATVRSLHNGYFLRRSPINKGAVVNCGKVAVLQVGKIFIQVSAHSHVEGDPGFFLGFGIDIELCDIVSVKACTSFRAGYEAISTEIYNAATPGAAGTVLTALPYKKRPVPLYPFEEISEDNISKAKFCREK